MKILCSAELQEEHHVRLHEAVVYKPHLAEALLQTVLGWANTKSGRTADTQRRLRAMEAPGRFKNPTGT